MVVVGGRPAIGKTSFLINILINLSKSNVKCKFFSLELYDKELKAKISKAVGDETKTLEIVFSNTTFDDEMSTSFTGRMNAAETAKAVITLSILLLCKRFSPKEFTKEQRIDIAITETTALKGRFMLFIKISLNTENMSLNEKDSKYS